MVLVILAILIIAILLAFFNNPEKQKQESPNDPVRTNIENSKIENVEGKEVYKL